MNLQLRKWSLYSDKEQFYAVEPVDCILFFKLISSPFHIYGLRLTLYHAVFCLALERFCIVQIVWWKLFFFFIFVYAFPQIFFFHKLLSTYATGNNFTTSVVLLFIKYGVPFFYVSELPENMLYSILFHVYSFKWTRRKAVQTF